MAEPDPAGPLAGGAQKHFGRGRMRIFFQKMMFHKPEVVDAEPVGKLHLLQGVGEQPLLVAECPGPGELVLVEDPESHTGP